MASSSSFQPLRLDIHDSNILDLDEFIEDIYLAVLIPVKAGAGEEFVEDRTSKQGITVAMRVGSGVGVGARVPPELALRGVP